MYNAELKNKFIEQYTTSISARSSSVALFNAFEKYELKWNADVCTVGVEELSAAFGEIVGFRTVSQKSRLSVLQAYARWCLSTGVPGACNSAFHIDDVGIEKLKRQTVANSTHLQAYLNQICAPESLDTVDNVYRCYYWLAYSGMNESDAVQVRAQDVDIENMVVRHNGMEFPIYREAIQAFRKCATLDGFQSNHPNYTNKRGYRPRGTGDLLLRASNSTVNVKLFRVTMSQKSAELERMDSSNKNLVLNLSYHRVWISGLFYRTYEAERAGMPVDFLDAAEQFMYGKTYKLSRCDKTINNKQRQVANDFLKDYNRWKLAYSI